MVFTKGDVFVLHLYGGSGLVVLVVVFLLFGFALLLLFVCVFFLFLFFVGGGEFLLNSISFRL